MHKKHGRLDEVVPEFRGAKGLDKDGRDLTGGINGRCFWRPLRGLGLLIDRFPQAYQAVTKLAKRSHC